MKADRIHTDLLSYLKYPTLACGYDIKYVLMTGSKHQPSVSTLKEYLLGIWRNFLQSNKEGSTPIGKYDWITSNTWDRVKMTSPDQCGISLIQLRISALLFFH